MKKFLLSVGMLAAVITACVLTSCQDEDLSDAKVKTVATSYDVPVATAAQEAAAAAQGMEYQYQVNGQIVTAEEYQAAAANVTGETNFTIAVVNTANGSVVSSSSFVLRPMTEEQAQKNITPTIENTFNGITTNTDKINLPVVNVNATTGAVEIIGEQKTVDAEPVNKTHDGGQAK